VTGGEGEVARARDFRPDIQGLRAIAVGVVVLYHAGVPVLRGGYVGVDVFFVISGFLITSHLLRTLDRTGRVEFAQFYARRARRILPASFVVLVLSVIAAVLWYPPLLMEQVWSGRIATALYVPNYLFAVNGTDYLAETTPSLFQHYWSLGIEEQFYLVWPLLLTLGWMLVKSHRTRFILLIALVGVSFASGVFLTYESQPWAFFSLPTRAWELGVGGIAAFLLARRPPPLPGAAAAIAGWIGVLGIVLAAVLFDSSTPFPSYWAAVPVAATALVIISGSTGHNLGPERMLSTRPMLFIGAISYSLYLVHWPALQIPEVSAGQRLPLWLTVMIALACVPLAWALYKWVESPARNAPILSTARPRRSLMLAGAASVTAIVVATGAYAYSETRPLYITRVAEAIPASAPPVFTTFVPSNLTPTLRDASGDQPVIYADDCHLGFSETGVEGCVYGDPAAPRIALLGDSHAAQWFPALFPAAQDHGYAIEVHTKSACPAISATVLRDGVPYRECDQWRSAAIDYLNSTRPSLVMLASYGTYELDGETIDEWGEALTSTLNKLESPVVVIADTPNMGITPAICLSANLADIDPCAIPRDAALSAPTRPLEVAAAENAGAPYLDLTDYLCGPTSCQAITGNTLIYRDEHHITATYSAQLSAPLWEALRIALK